MRRLIFTLLTAVLILVFASSGYALTATQTGTDVTISYDEPTENTDGSLLDDLSHITITNSFDAQGIDVSASALTGGGIGISHIISLAITAGQQYNVTFTLVACDFSDNCSVPNSVTVRIDRLAPAGVQ